LLYWLLQTMSQLYCPLIISPFKDALHLHFILPYTRTKLLSYCSVINKLSNKFLFILT